MPEPRLIAYYVIGNSSTDNSKRRVGWNIMDEPTGDPPLDGWPRFVRDHVNRYIMAFDAIQLHNPFGTRILPGIETEMQLNQYLRAKAAGLDRLTRNFTRTWRNFPKPQIHYYGYPNAQDSRFVGLLAQATTLPGRVLLDRYLDECIWPSWMGCRAGIGFDSLYGLNEEHYYTRLMRRVQASGVPTFIETWPSKDHPNLWADNFMVTSETVQRIDAGLSTSWAAPESVLTGECIVLQNTYYVNPANPGAGVLWGQDSNYMWEDAIAYRDGTFVGWFFDWMREQWGRGRSLAINPTLLNPVPEEHRHELKAALSA
jgi:hypothetical protein